MYYYKESMDKVRYVLVFRISWSTYLGEQEGIEVSTGGPLPFTTYYSISVSYHVLSEVKMCGVDNRRCSYVP